MKGTKITVAKAASVEHIDFQIHSSYKDVVEVPIEIVQDLFPPIA